MLLAGILAGGISVSPAGAQSAAPPVKPASVGAPTRYETARFSKRAVIYYGQIWGVDSLSVKSVEAGELIRFAYRVVNSDRATPLTDKKVEPTLVDPRAGVELVIPQLEKVGKLRQTSTPIDGRSYWMAFSNKGGHVKRGDHVTVVIGQFRAEGLVVE